VLHITDDTIAQLLDLKSVTERVTDAFSAWGRGLAHSTQRVRSSASGAMASAMAAVVPPYTGGKIYATKQGVFTFVNVLFDMDGRFLCTLDGDALTRFRTPAACALAIRRLAAPGSNRAALIGAGRQGWYHLEMLAAELPLERMTVCDVRAEAASAMVDRALAAGIPAAVAETPEAAVCGADVIVTVTQSTTALFPAEAITDRALICAVGATKYDRCEIGPDVVARSVAVVCDDAVGSRVECGDLIQAAKAGKFDWDRAVELRDLAAGTVAVPRAGAGPVLFETQGVALQDVATAGLVYERYAAAREAGQ
jgi:ornithine cyclodeaminase/alanine dehydrogenase-like protein (mu-crystallin family)